MGAILAAGAAPWVAKAGVLMQIKPLVIAPLFGMEIGRYENIRFIETVDFQVEMNRIARERLENVKFILNRPYPRFWAN